MLVYLSLIEGEDEKYSFEKIYRENYQKMYHIALGILKKKESAENAVHEAFLSIAERYEKYSKLKDKELAGLCITIVKSKVIDQLRFSKRYSDEEIENIVLINKYINYEPEKYVENQEYCNEIWSIMQKIPEVLRIVLVLKYYYNYNNREIAKILNVSIKTVDMRLYRAKQKMRGLLNEK